MFCDVVTCTHVAYWLEFPLWGLRRCCGFGFCRWVLMVCNLSVVYLFCDCIYCGVGCFMCTGCLVCVARSFLVCYVDW